MGEFIYSFIQIIFIAVELSLMYMRYKTRNDPDMDVSINMYNVLLVDTCLIYLLCVLCLAKEFKC